MATKSGVRRACLSDLLLAAGALLLLGAALLWGRNALAAQETANRRYLAASVPLTAPLPDDNGFSRLAASLPSPTPESPKKQAALAGEVSGQAVAIAVSSAEPAIPVAAQTATPLVGQEPGAVEALAAAPTASTSEAGAPAEAILPASNPIVHLAIPALKVKRAVVPVGLRPDGKGGLVWDTEAIFATNNRPDLVGHLIGSAYPGQGGNIILIGHNYNQVDYGWEGVFVNIKNLKAGDRIVIRGQDGNEYTYVVQLVKQVPWRSKNAKELEKHFKFLGPSTSERLTLVTCGGANIWPFPARVYVVAVPEGR
jgi:hypothetical protein